MGLRFHKSFALNKLLRVNVSKRGLSLGVGPKGASMNVSTRGLQGSVGVPGSGLSYRRHQSWSTSGRRGLGGLWLFLLIVVIIAAVLYFGQGISP